jgi:ferredoxin
VIRRRRTDYQPDRSNCVACGRCFWYCPSEQARQGWIQLDAHGGQARPLNEDSRSL